MGSLGKVDERDLIAQSLHGQQFFIPDPNELFQGWPKSTNPNVSTLHRDIEETLARLFPPGKRRSKLLIADPALFAAMWWPYASLERLSTAAYLSLWLFAWDDETDTCELSDLSKNFGEAQIFRAATLVRVRDYLGLESDPSEVEKAICTIGTRHSIFDLFERAGRSLRETCAFEERQALMRQIEFFVEMSTLEQKVQLSGKLPSVKAYQRRRMGSSAVGVCLAIHEYTLGQKLPQYIREHPAMRSIWDQTNVIISVCNDILSIRKEVAQNQVDSLIPLLYVDHLGDGQAAMDEAVGMLEKAIQRFDDAAAGLLTEVTLRESGEGNHYEAIKEDVISFTNSCRYACTANLDWSLQSGRYRLDAENVDGGLVFSV